MGQAQLFESCTSAQCRQELVILRFPPELNVEVRDEGPDPLLGLLEQLDERRELFGVVDLDGPSRTGIEQRALGESSPLRADERERLELRSAAAARERIGLMAVVGSREED